MKLLSFSLTVSAALCVSAMPAQAQVVEPMEVPGEQQVGTRFLQEPETVDAARGRLMQKRVAHCAYRKNRREIANLLAHSNFYQIDYAAIDLEASEMFEEFGMGNCLGRVMRDDEYKMYMRYTDSTMRNLFAEEAYIHDGEGPLTISEDTPERLMQRYGRDGFHPQIATMSNIADCIVYKDAATAHELLANDPGSEEEQAAVNTLAPTLIECMNTKQKEVTISTSLIRQIVADGLWSRSYYGRATK